MSHLPWTRQLTGSTLTSWQRRGDDLWVHVDNIARYGLGWTGLLRLGETSAVLAHEARSGVTRALFDTRDDLAAATIADPTRFRDTLRDLVGTDRILVTEVAIAPARPTWWRIETRLDLRALVWDGHTLTFQTSRQIGPGETTDLRWTITCKDADLKFRPSVRATLSRLTRI